MTRSPTALVSTVVPKIPTAFTAFDVWYDQTNDSIQVKFTLTRADTGECVPDKPVTIHAIDPAAREYFIGTTSRCPYRQTGFIVAAFAPESPRGEWTIWAEFVGDAQFEGCEAEG